MLEVREHGLGGQVGRAQVEAEQPLELVDRRLVHRLIGREAADEVHERADVAGRAHGAGDVVGVGEVGDDRAQARARLEVRARLDGHDDPPAVGEQRGDDMAAETTGAAGYKSGVAGHRRHRIVRARA